MVNMMSVIFLKSLGMDNSTIGLWTSAFYIPWTIKFLWAPLVDLYSTKRTWIVVAQAVLAFLSFGLAITILSKEALQVKIWLLLLIAFVSATHDIAIDGYYIGILDSEKQALFVGVRNAVYKVAWLFGSGALVFLAGNWAQNHGNSSHSISTGWCISFLVCTVVFLCASLFHLVVLPKELIEKPDSKKPSGPTVATFTKVFTSFFGQPRIALVVTYILIFRMGDAFLLKMAQPFLIDPIDKGGLDISLANIGIIYGTIGVIFLLIGGLIGGWLVSKYGLKRCLLPTAVVQNTAILLYCGLASWKPQIPVVCVANAIEQLAYGLGTSAYTVFLLSVVKKQYKAAHYAIATALMALGLMLPGAISGYLADYLGYQNFFLFAFITSLPGIICIFYLPIQTKPSN